MMRVRCVYYYFRINRIPARVSLFGRIESGFSVSIEFPDKTVAVTALCVLITVIISLFIVRIYVRSGGRAQ